MQITKVKLTPPQKVELEFQVYFGTKPSLQKRCQIVLMKSEGKSSREIAQELSVSEPTVNRWVNRYLSNGFDGLLNKAGQGRKPIMDASDEKIVKEAIEKDRLSVMKAKERWQNATGKKACRNTFRSFLSALAQDLDV